MSHTVVRAKPARATAAWGQPARRPLLPGMIALGLAWPARQMLIAVDRPYRLCLATLLGLAVTAVAGSLGAIHLGLAGVAWGMSIGYAAIYAFTSLVAFLPEVGVRRWVALQVRLAATHAIHLSTQAVDLVYAAAGASAIYADNPIQRRFQDVHVATQHVQGRLSHYQVVGRHVLGLEPDLLWM